MQQCVQQRAERRRADRNVGDEALRQHRVQHERRQQRRPCPQDDHAAALTVADLHQPVVEVALVGRGDALRRLARRMIANSVSRIGTPRMNSGMNSGARKKYVWPAYRAVRVGAAADDAGADRHQQAEQQRAAVAHEDPRRVEVVRQEADAHPDGDDRDAAGRCSATTAGRARVGQPQAVDEERQRADRDDAGGEPVETVDQVDRLGHAEQPHDGDQQDPVVADGRRRRRTAGGSRTSSRRSTSALPATPIVPITLAGAEISRMSSNRPTTNINDAASNTPRGSSLRAKIVSKLIHQPRHAHGHDEADEHRDPADVGRRRRCGPAARPARQPSPIRRARRPTIGCAARTSRPRRPGRSGGRGRRRHERRRL